MLKKAVLFSTALLCAVVPNESSQAKSLPCVEQHALRNDGREPKIHKSSTPLKTKTKTLKQKKSPKTTHTDTPKQPILGKIGFGAAITSFLLIPGVMAILRIPTITSLGLWLAVFFIFALSVVAVVLSILSLKKEKDVYPKSWAVIGLAIGAFVLLLSLAFLILFSLMAFL